MILDDTQVGCGRTGRFFSFETADIHADIIVLSVAVRAGGAHVLAACDLPWAHPSAWLVAHGQIASIRAGFAVRYPCAPKPTGPTAASRQTFSKGAGSRLAKTSCTVIRAGGSVCADALIQLVMSGYQDLAEQVARRAFDVGLLIETSGADDEVLKLLPALTTRKSLLIKGLEIIEHSLAEVLRDSPARVRGRPGPRPGTQILTLNKYLPATLLFPAYPALWRRHWQAWRRSIVGADEVCTKLRILGFLRVGQYLLRRPFFDNTPLVKKHTRSEICFANCISCVTIAWSGRVRPPGAESHSRLHPPVRGQGQRWARQQHDVGVHGQRAGNGNALLLTARQL